ncbi:TPA: helix-turn-helix transcriptional regulator [Elizabethkingia anophelis]|uniref:helix-turn-helix transcriptional regulator n=1 Tax=Elizabethkingia TaxID=308865 RepID=UPI0016252A44|nr:MULTISPECIES: AraC family transcriptional regulator [Elizabethkingia]MCT3674846.1 helix-turn-helix transcriptional regulator [Elizabethkingia anophelis]MCT3682329.1 helix-turn-helix transcriptional regulator [Elizabethkingia anophelis]MCT3703993.1 helix-turn-helix transcriptional regulator [Elizabethkingia anophelis]MCT3771403.1 helix-turn-helix transcriptional regulator [Elizabethkingia anophelis]MCT3781657.1 helix-turn-helix transcriptional regulator [Elizabethkingia anophelis]
MRDITVPKIIELFANLLGTEIENRKLEIPDRFGKGYCRGFVFNEHIRMIISNYELYEDLTIENPDIDTDGKMIFFKFQNVFSKSGIPSVMIGTSRLNTDDVISIHSNTATINIEIDAHYLNSLFYSYEKSPILKGLLQNAQPYLFEQVLYSSLQEIVNDIISENTEEVFELFFLRVKAEELICRLLMDLGKRDGKQLYALNVHDIEAIYRIKVLIIEDLGVPPVISELSVIAGMSPTKLKRLFSQIFGNSIFSYYQDLRMKEAAALLKEKKYSVSEVGYKLGFTNLGHFSRIFKQHIGMSPKKYAVYS